MSECLFLSLSSSRALAIVPDLAIAYAYGGKAHAMLGNVTETRKWFEEAEKRAPNDFAVLTLK